jgi:hypothetical protein
MISESKGIAYDNFFSNGITQLLVASSSTPSQLILRFSDPTRFSVEAKAYSG